MNRKDFLRKTGILGLGITLPNAKHRANSMGDNPIQVEDCVLIPTETAGPFPLDLTENDTFFRQDITDSQEGVPLSMKLKIIGSNNCGPMQNVRVNIWHCDKDGVYSGYNTGNNPGDADAIHLRGYQFTDANGEAEFTTIFPGWYNGRICHIHFQVYVSSSYSAISQLTFPIDTKNALYSDNSSLYTKGDDPLSFEQDNIFSDGHEYQVATLELDETTGEYSSFLEVTVEGGTTTGVGHLERETAKVFELGQNFPNPYIRKTNVPISLHQAADIKLELWDLSGKKVATVFEGRKSAGKSVIEVIPSQLGLSPGNYVYQLEAKIASGTYRLPKLMTYQE